MHADAAAGGDEGVAVMQRVCEVGQAGVGSRTGRVDFGRTFHGERLEWPFGIEFLNKVIEAGLLLKTVHCGRSGCLFLQRQMHALVAAVLLWVVNATLRGPTNSVRRGEATPGVTSAAEITEAGSRISVTRPLVFELARAAS